MKTNLSEWKSRYDVKIREKSQLSKEIKAEYENQLKQIEEGLQGLSQKERKEQEKWKKLELKAKYKLEESEKKKAIGQELKELRNEKREIEKEVNEKKTKALKKSPWAKI